MEFGSSKKYKVLNVGNARALERTQFLCSRWMESRLRRLEQRHELLQRDSGKIKL